MSERFRPGPRPSTATGRDVTVVVATRNRVDQLLATLPRHEAPVIVVDNGSTDGSPEAVTAAFPLVRMIRLGRNAGAAARNVGVEAATTRYVAFADDDSFWAPGALAHAVRLLDEYPAAGLLTARVLVGVECRVDPISTGMAEAPLGRPADLPGPAVLGFLGCAAIVRRGAYQQVGGFAARLGAYGEEALLALDLAAAGWGLAYVEDLVVHHLPQPTGRDPAGRRRLEERNRLLTAGLRRPAGVVFRRVRAALRTPAGRAGLAAALRELPWVLAHRRRVPAEVEAGVAALER